MRTPRRPARLVPPHRVAALTTRDMDICPALDAATLRQLAKLLGALGAKPRYVPGYNDLAACQAWTPEPATAAHLDHEFTTPLGQLDVVPAPYGPHGQLDRLDYARLDARAVTLTAFGVPVRVACLDDLIASKLSARRPKDHAARAELERVRRAAERGEHLPGLEAYAGRADARADR